MPAGYLCDIHYRGVIETMRLLRKRLTQTRLFVAIRLWRLYGRFEPGSANLRELPGVRLRSAEIVAQPLKGRWRC